jgi:hypothetical protein
MSGLVVYGVSLGMTRCIVAAPSKAAARRAFNMSPYTFDQYVCETENADEIERATSEPGQVWLIPIDALDGEWIRVDVWRTSVPNGRTER